MPSSQVHTIGSVRIDRVDVVNRKGGDEAKPPYHYYRPIHLKGGAWKDVEVSDVNKAVDWIHGRMGEEGPESIKWYTEVRDSSMTGAVLAEGYTRIFQLGLDPFRTGSGPQFDPEWVEGLLDAEKAGAAALDDYVTDDYETFCRYNESKIRRRYASLVKNGDETQEYVEGKVADQRAKLDAKYA